MTKLYIVCNVFNTCAVFWFLSWLHSFKLRFPSLFDHISNSANYKTLILYIICLTIRSFLLFWVRESTLGYQDYKHIKLLKCPKSTRLYLYMNWIVYGWCYNLRKWLKKCGNLNKLLRACCWRKCNANEDWQNKKELPTNSCNLEMTRNDVTIKTLILQRNYFFKYVQKCSFFSALKWEEITFQFEKDVRKGQPLLVT